MQSRVNIFRKAALSDAFFNKQQQQHILQLQSNKSGNISLSVQFTNGNI